MGVGIWAMHFIGMMAFRLPIPIHYDIIITMLSLFAAIGASAYALSIASARNISIARLALSAVILGAGICVMHYTGMGAITITPGIRYEAKLFAASVGIAVTASFVALWLFFRLRHGRSRAMILARVSAAVVMGLAICGMHYTGMAATIFATGAYCMGGVQLDQGWLAAMVAIIALGLIGITLGLLVFDLHMRSRVRRHNAELEVANAKLRHAATHDALTGLPNRSLLADRLHQAISHSQRQPSPFAVALIDLDRFKSVNDSLGHLAGDELLRQIVMRLQPLLRASDTLARMGGDEFVMILADGTCEGAAQALHRIQQDITRPITVSGVELRISCSIGVALYPADAKDSETLMRHADAAMYHAKKEGRDNIQFFAEGMASFVREKLEIESGLRHALANNEFVLHYQPKVDISSGRIDGAEALIRWAHPERGLVLPAAFIPVAEETGLIRPIGEWVLREACSELRRWHDAGFSRLRMSVNLSAEQFQQSALLKIVQSALEDAGIPPQYLELELTESCVMRDAERSIQVLTELADLGVCISVDDFGTGYSSLSYLSRLPLQRLKIDRSFIRDIENSRDDAEIIRAIVSMAHSLKLNVTAEGVETGAQHDFLRTLGCEQYQGFLCSPPVPADLFLEALGAAPEPPASLSPTQRLRALGRIARNRLLGDRPLPGT